MFMTIPEAVEIAKKHLVEVMPDLASSTIELDELETPPSGSAWRFTFTAIRPSDPNNSNVLELLRSRRSTKSVEVNSVDGSLLAIRNRAA
ncbi:hypothetical protein [Granulicella tundricola]|nr:hypothetical protein [Granulicella tundricola]